MRYRRLPADVDQWWVFDNKLTMSEYVNNIIEAFRNVPNASGRATQDDRKVAAALFKRRVPYEAVEGAFILAAERRKKRPYGRPPLKPISSIRYFLPIIKEILHTPIDPADISYLWWKNQSR